MEAHVQFQPRIQDYYSRTRERWQNNHSLQIVINIQYVYEQNSHLGKVIQTQPTIGSNVEEVRNKNVRLQVKLIKFLAEYHPFCRSGILVVLHHSIREFSNTQCNM